MEKFKKASSIKDIKTWILECAFEDFGIQINEAHDFLKLDEVVLLNGYNDKGEWVREKIRFKIKNQEDSK